MREYLSRRLPYFFITLLVIVLDRATKTMIESRLAPWRSVSVIPGLFDLTYVRNPGGVFGIFKNLDEGVRGLLFTIVPITAILLIAAYQSRVPASRKLTQISLALILGGALGNLVDRFRYGHVIDFLDFYFGSHHWPAFNLADSAICVGVATLMIETLLANDQAPALDAEGPPAGAPPADLP